MASSLLRIGLKTFMQNVFEKGITAKGLSCRQVINIHYFTNNLCMVYIADIPLCYDISDGYFWDDINTSYNIFRLQT